MRKNAEIKIYGVNACLAFFQKRPEDLIRVYLAEDHLKKFKEVISFCVKKKLAYHIVDDQELETITKATHHEGVCFLVREKNPLFLADFLKKKTKPLLFLAFDGIDNPHNLGAIMRVAAHFGVDGIISDNTKIHSASAIRTAEGGYEFLNIFLVKNLKETLMSLQNTTIITTSSHAKISLESIVIKESTVLILGNEAQGVSPAIEKLANKRVSIPGTGNVESLNVTSAASVLLYALTRSFQ